LSVLKRVIRKIFDIIATAFEKVDEHIFVVKNIGNRFQWRVTALEIYSVISMTYCSLLFLSPFPVDTGKDNNVT